MRTFSLLTSLLILIGCLTLSAQDPTPESPQPPKIGKYGDLLKRVKAADTSVDFLEFRLSFAQTRHYKPYRDDLRNTQNEMRKAFGSGDHTSAVSKAEKILKKEFINVEAHVMCASAYDSLGDSTKARFHDFVSDGLLQSIFASGDGRSEESAYLVVLIDEEYAVMNVLGYKVNVQSLREGQGEIFYDVFEVVDPATDEEKEIYFNIDLPFSKLKSKYR